MGLLAVAQRSDGLGLDVDILAIFKLEGDEIRSDDKLVAPVLRIDLGGDGATVVADAVKGVAPGVDHEG
jgi:hypothetical protein